MTRLQRYLPVLVLLATLPAGNAAYAQGAADPSASHTAHASRAVDGSAPRASALAAPAVHYRTITVDGVDVFYREAGPRDAPVLLLLHGFPTSSHMFRNLIPQLADRYRVIAPDYPGYGHSSMPALGEFEYTFAHMARVMEQFTQALGLTRYTLYVQDYGAPIGFRLAVQHPERVEALIVQNGNAYEEGLSEFWDPIRALWREPSEQHRAAVRAFLEPEATRWQYTHGVSDSTRISPDTWTVDQRLLERPGNKEIQLAMVYDYRTNVPLYPEFQAYFRAHQPPTLIVWGRNDMIFPAAGALAYRRDLENAELHLLDTGHFALEEKGDEIAQLIRAFLERRLARN